MPYIGLTGFRNFAEVEYLLPLFNAHRTDPRYRLHVGVMMSYKTMHGLPTRWADVHPRNEAVASIFASRETMNCLHYADPIGIDLAECLTLAISFGGEGIHAIQLDMTWPDPAEIEKAVAQSGKKLEVILQLNHAALMATNWNPTEVVRRLMAYTGTITHVLLDLSGGRGLPMDASGLLPFAKVINDHYPELGLVVAGGLGPDTVELVVPVHRHYPGISIDAESKLRASGEATDPLDLDRCTTYLTKSLALLQ